MVKVEIPAILHKDLDLKSEIKIEAKTVNELASQIIKLYPQLESTLFDSEEKLKQYIRFYLNEEMLEPQKYQEPILKDKDIISLILPISGG